MQTELSKEEQQVYDVIRNCEKNRITQREIAMAVFVGSHEKYENYPVKESTLRKVRFLIRELRMKHNLFILSDEEGYWLMKERSEAVDYIERMERIAKATTRGYFDTFRAMQKAFGVTSTYFSKQGELF